MATTKRARSDSAASGSEESAAAADAVYHEGAARTGAALEAADTAGAYRQRVSDAIAAGVGAQLARYPYSERYKNMSFEVRVVADWTAPHDGTGVETHMAEDQHEHVLEVRVARRQLVHELQPVAYTLMRDAVERGITQVANLQLGKHAATAIWLSGVAARRQGIFMGYHVTYYPPPAPKEAGELPASMRAGGDGGRRLLEIMLRTAGARPGPDDDDDE